MPTLFCQFGLVNLLSISHTLLFTKKFEYLLPQTATTAATIAASCCTLEAATLRQEYCRFSAGVIVVQNCQKCNGRTKNILSSSCLKKTAICFGLGSVQASH